MTRDDIIPCYAYPAPLPFSPYLFMENVSATERVSRTMYTAEQMQAYALAEREACAKICDSLRLPDQPIHNYAVIMCRNEIKARGRT